MELEASIEFAGNPEPRCPCILLLDTSGSMKGKKIDQLNAGLVAFRDALDRDPVARKRVEVCVIAFDTNVIVVENFVTIDTFEPPVLAAYGQTRMGAGIVEALDTLASRKTIFKANGIAYYRPWLILITDGEPTDPETLEMAKKRLAEEVDSKRVAFFPIGVEGVDMGQLRAACPKNGNPPVRLSGLDFQPMFQWLSSSLQQVSNSQVDVDVGAQVTLAPITWSA